MPYVTEPGTQTSPYGLHLKKGKNHDTGLFKLRAVPPPRVVDACCSPPSRAFRKGRAAAALRAPSLGLGQRVAPARCAA